jgi:hypothetical protein
VHLQDEPGRELLALEPALHFDHRELDEIGGGALHRRIDGGALRRGTARPAAALMSGSHSLRPNTVST